MQWLNLVSEDGGVQRLKVDNCRPVRARSVDAVSPYPSSHEAHVGDGHDAGRKPIQDRRQGERRKGGDRRKQQQPVLLDTRSRHNRRAIEDRRHSEADEKPAAAPRKRIDLYA